MVLVYISQFLHSICQNSETHIIAGYYITTVSYKHFNTAIQLQISISRISIKNINNPRHAPCCGQINNACKENYKNGRAVIYQYLCLFCLLTFSNCN